MANINPYLTFKGNCEEAFNFYKSVFGGEFATIMRMGDGSGGMEVPDAAKNQIMHVALPVGDTAMLMGSDAMEGFGPPFNAGNNFSVAVGPKSKEEADKLYNGLAAGGTQTMPMADAFWGAYFGMLVDKFGIQWMVNFDASRNA
ncbi:MAG: VOC family protein [Acidobacteriota bacterium]